MRILFCILTIFTALVTGQVQAAVEIPMEVRHGLIWLRVTSSNHSAPLNFLLDSGAGVSVLDLTAARAMGEKLDSPLVVRGVGGRAVAFEVSKLDLKVAGTSVPSPRLALDLSAISRGCGQRVDGLIGADFFRKQLVQIDFSKQVLRLLSAGELPVAAAIPLASRGDALCVRLAVDGNGAGWARVDTGCDTALEWVTTARGEKPRAGTSIAATTGARGAVAATVQLGDLRLADVPTGFRASPIFAGESGLLGTGLLNRFTVTFDVKGKRLFLTPR